MATETGGEPAAGREAGGPAPPKARGGRVSPPWRPLFLRILADTGNVLASCREVGISRSVAYKARRRCPVFRRLWKLALADACDVLEATARGWALGGSEKMMIFLLKAYRPRRFREPARREPRAPESTVADTALRLYAEGKLTPEGAEGRPGPVD